MRKIVCNCGNEFEADIPEVYDSADHPDILDQILDGTFLSHTCPNCATTLKLELPVRIKDASHMMDVQLFPDAEREKFLGGNLSPPDAGRIVFGYAELVEKVAIYLNKLDDRVIETIKYFYLKRGGGEKDISLKLDSVDGDDLMFHIHGLKEDEIGVVKISLDFYRKIEKDLPDIESDENLQVILTTPYVSVEKVYIEAQG
jgi:hypothetical protein